MLAVARRRFGDRVELVEASATDDPVPGRLVRPPHVHVPAALRRRPRRDARRARPRRPPRRHDRVARVLRSARRLAAALGALRRRRPARSPGRLISRGWYDVGRFLGPSIRGFYEQWPLERQLELWRRGRDRGRARATDEPRRRRRDLGQAGASGMRPAFYALPRGGWRDYVTLLHLPYTAWHLSYVVVGGCLAAEVSWGRLGLTVLAFFLAMGIGAHALDELAGRPLQTAIPVGRARRARGRLGRRRLRDRDRRRSELQPLDPAADRRRGVPRAGLQPRALRRPLPLRPLVRARLGRLPGRHRLRRLRRDASARPP